MIELNLGKSEGESRYIIENEEGVQLTELGEGSLDELREASRANGTPLERLDLLDADLECANCESAIADRFGASLEGELLCWDCVSGSAETKDHREVSLTTDPAKVTLSNSSLNHKSLCDYVVNVATGCTHGCKFCYVPSTPNIRARQDMLKDQVDVDDGQKEWGTYLLYRDDMPERIGRKLERKRTWKQSDRGRGVVMLSSGTDCYQDRRTAQITRETVIELVKHRIPVRILTRSPAVCRDIDVYQKASELSEDGNLVRVGSSIPCLDDKQVRAIEPNAPAPSSRLEALKEMSDADVPVYVSMSPTYPTQGRSDLENLMREFVQLDPEVIFHEPINPRGQNFDMTVNAAKESGETELAEELAKLQNKEQWVDYSLRQMRQVEELGEELDLPVHIWPDKQVIRSLSGEERQKWKKERKSVSPESIASVELPN